MAFTPIDEPGMRDWMGPGMVNQAVRQVIQIAWAALPPEKENAAVVERVVSHLVERALKDLREDRDRFGLGG